MRFRPYLGLFVVLAIASAACSGSPRGEDGAAPPKSTTTLSSAPGALHDTVPAEFDSVDKSGSAPRSRSKSGASGAGTAPTNDTTATTPGSGGTTPTTTTTATTTTTMPPKLPAEKCPEPKTCRRYRFVRNEGPRRWKIGPDGRATIRYRINPSGAVSTITPEQIEGAVAAAMETWRRAAPTLRFVYEGRTDRLAVQGDGHSVISFNAPETARTWGTSDANGDLVEFDIYFRPGGWVWAPCEQRDGSCTPYSSPGPTPGSSSVDLQSLATHEVGHALWLDDMFDYDQDRYLTMWPGCCGDSDSRHWSTLALGDVLGIRALYPTSTPMPTIYEP